MENNKIEEHKQTLQQTMLFDKEEGFDEINFREVLNPEIDFDILKEILEEVENEQQ